MSCRSLATALVLSSALLPLAAAHAAPCQGATAGALAIGQVVRLEPGPARALAIELASGQGVIADLSTLDTPAAKDGEGEDGDNAKAPPRNIAICSTAGVPLAPQAGEVFETGGSAIAIDGGTRLRFVAPATGTYTLWVDASGEAREVLVRNHDLGKGGGIATVKLGGSAEGRISTSAPLVYSFTAPAGQWVEIKSTSEGDTLLHLAGPDRAGAYSELAKVDDSDGLNPVIRRRLAVAGTSYIQLESLSDETQDFTLTVKPSMAPPAPPPPAAMRPGTAISAKLSGDDEAKLYVLPVVSGHSYRIELSAEYDGVVKLGLPNPVDTGDGKEGLDAGFTEVVSADDGTTGTEKIDFTARQSGSLLVLVKSFRIGETDGSFRLIASDQGG